MAILAINWEIKRQETQKIEIRNFRKWKWLEYIGNPFREIFQRESVLDRALNFQGAIHIRSDGAENKMLAICDIMPSDKSLNQKWRFNFMDIFANSRYIVETASNLKGHFENYENLCLMVQ